MVGCQNVRTALVAGGIAIWANGREGSAARFQSRCSYCDERKSNQGVGYTFNDVGNRASSKVGAFPL
jgi:hypothetical protein